MIRSIEENSKFPEFSYLKKKMKKEDFS